eukprot:5115283-Amphidinium_carterae.1
MCECLYGWRGLIELESKQSKCLGNMLSHVDTTVFGALLEQPPVTSVSHGKVAVKQIEQDMLRNCHAAVKSNL